MISNTWLFLFIIGLVAYTGWTIATNNTTPEERDEMLNEKDWF